MEREIKFEYGFRSQNGIVKKVYHLSEIPNIKDKCDVWNVLPIVYVRQFLGIKDKNGFDVYDGDILKWLCSKSGSKKERLYTVEISFGSHNHKLSIHDDGEIWATGKSYWNEKDREVIGNKYENSELLVTDLQVCV